MFDLHRFHVLKKSGFGFIVVAFFLVLLWVGLAIYRDYGVHIDEPNNQGCGARYWRYVQGFNMLRPTPYGVTSDTTHDAIHGPLFEMFLVVLKDMLRLSDSRDIIWMRHLYIFLIFYLGVFFFYLLCQFHFKNQWISLTGCLFLILHPRIFSHAFYDSVDIAFFSFYIISTYTLFQYFKRKTMGFAALHAIACAALVGVRMAGLVVPLVTFIFMGVGFLKEKECARKRVPIFMSTMVFLFLFIALAILFNPLMWADPVMGFLRMVRGGSFTDLSGSPWFYNPVWIVVTTPLLYIFFFFMGVVSCGHRLFHKGPEESPSRLNILILWLLFLVPLVLPVILRTRLFNEWRHHYFVYPIFLMVALMGMNGCWYLIRSISYAAMRRSLAGAFLFIIGACMASTIVTMVRLHPFQNIYGNLLKEQPWMERLCIYKGGGGTKDPDTWHLSYAKAYQYILDHDKRPVIMVDGIATTAFYAVILPAESRNRFIFSNPFQFSSEEFSKDYSASALIGAISSDPIVTHRVQVPEGKKDIDRLNKLLRKHDLKHFFRDVPLLKKMTGKRTLGLDDEIRLNRRILEVVYPLQCPKAAGEIDYWVGLEPPVVGNFIEEHVIVIGGIRVVAIYKSVPNGGTDGP